jgi:hypothetical protein
MPSQFEEALIRVYAKRDDPELCKKIVEAFDDWVAKEVSGQVKKVHKSPKKISVKLTFK